MMAADMGGAKQAPPGQVAFTTPGTYSWVCPADVLSVSVVCVGGGGGGAGNGSSGGGGGLGWKNNIAVTPGATYTVFVGRASSYGESPVNGDSYFISGTTVCGKGGAGIYASCLGGTFVGSGGGDGITGGSNAGAGGAGGYSGNGPGSGAGASGTYHASPPGSSGGGGVGLLGQGANGTFYNVVEATNTLMPGGGGGSGGFNGEDAYSSSSTWYFDGPYFQQAITTRAGGNGGKYGGGGGASVAGGPTGIGGSGAVRIIWPGDYRQFPSTNTGDM